LAIAHDYLTQRGGAERVVLTLAQAFPTSTIHTAFYDRHGTFPDFASCDIRPLPLDRIPGLRTRHRLAMPLLAPAFSLARVDADVTLCSSSGWAHGIRATGAKVVYCYTPARWLYQVERYLRGSSLPTRTAMGLLGPPLRHWDRRAAASCDTYIAISTVVRQRIADCYGIDAELIHPPCSIDTSGEVRPVEGLSDGFVLCVSRLLPYKNVDAVVGAFGLLPDQRLVVVGTGPEATRLASAAPANVTFVGEVDDSALRWLYRACSGLVSASYEDFGLTPIEAAAFAKPSAVLRWGGFLDTVQEGATGTFFDEPEPAAIAGAIRLLDRTRWVEAELVAHAEQFSPARFIQRISAVVARHRGSDAHS
jgi:glycosyltransferase involved in cell wall biosynthesis